MPPYLRLVPASACWNASKIIFCFSGAMPMPVSVTANAITAAARLQDRVIRDQPPLRGATVIATCPCAVNLNAFDSRFFKICCRRFGSVVNARGRAGVELDVERQILAFGHVAEVALDVSRSDGERHFFRLDRDRARFDLRQIQNVVDEVEQVGAGASGCSGRTRPASASDCLPRSPRAAGRESKCEFSGVRSSCDMFARNSDLYFDVSASSAAFSSSARRACSTSCSCVRLPRSARRAAWPCAASSSLVCCSSFCCDCSSAVSCCDCLQQVFGAHRRFDRVEHDADALRELLEEREVRRVKGCSEASSITALVWPSNNTGKTTMLRRHRVARGSI